MAGPQSGMPLPVMGGAGGGMMYGGGGDEEEPEHDHEHEQEQEISQPVGSLQSPEPLDIDERSDAPE